MLRIPCPHCGSRESLEFAYSGEIAPEPAASRSAEESDIDAYRRSLYLRDNPPGWTRERWFHSAGCGRYIVIERQRTTNETRPLAVVSAQ